MKTRIWLGTFETAEAAARAYDEAALLICVPGARTNFPADPRRPIPPPTQVLSPSLMAKLEKCRTVVSQTKAAGAHDHDEEFIEEMIEELLHYGSVEISYSSASASASSSSTWYSDE